MTRRSRYLLEVSQPHVMVPARIAALIESRTDISALRVQVRGPDPEATEVLEAIRMAAIEWRSSATGTVDDTSPELDTNSEWVSTTKAAELLGITGRAVVKAIHDDRLPAQRVGDRWRISREDIAQFKAASAA